MHLFAQTHSYIIEAINALQSEGVLPEALDISKVTVEPPRDVSHGDMATNVAMVLAKQARMKPRELAALLVKKLQEVAAIQLAEIAGPGFINLRFAPAFFQQVVPAIIAAGTAYGDSDIGDGQHINVEYVSANPTGPLHVGHARGAVVGDALAGLLQKAGYSVVKEYYINDTGAQIDVLARSAYLRYREALGEDIGTIPEGLYPGEYLIDVGKQLAEEHGDALGEIDGDTWLPIVRDAATNAMMQLIKDDLQDLGITHDVFASEKALHDAGAIENAIESLRNKTLVYQGVLEPPKGKKPDDWEEREQLLFKSSDFGDDADRPLQKPDESYTYFAADLAYLQDKIDREFSKLIYILGADHGGYIKRLSAACKGLSDGKVVVDVKLCQLVHLFKGGEPFKMSKRAGNFVTVRDLINEVGKDIIRFIMLTRKNDQSLDFDFEKVKEQSKDNPVFYVQYAHARAKSVLRLAQSEVPGAIVQMARVDDFSALDSEAELALLKKLAEWPRIVEAAAGAHEPHRIAFYLQELAAIFHSFYNAGNKDIQARFIVEENELLTAQRLCLAQAFSIVLASGLKVLGVTPVDEMR